MSARGPLALTVLRGDEPGRSLTLDRPLLIGSNRRSDVHVRDAAVSWNHARLWPEAGEHFVEDLGSANGTLLNGAPVHRASLKPGDILAVGSTLFGLHSVGEASPGVDGTRGAATPAGRAAAAPGNGRPQSTGSLLEDLARAQERAQRAEEERDAALRAQQALALELDQDRARSREIAQRLAELEAANSELVKAGRAAKASRSQVDKEIETLRNERDRWMRECADRATALERLEIQAAAERDDRRKREEEAIAREREHSSRISELSAAVLAEGGSAARESAARRVLEMEVSQLRERLQAVGAQVDGHRESFVAIERERAQLRGSVQSLEEALGRAVADKERCLAELAAEREKLEVLRRESERRWLELHAERDRIEKASRQEIDSVAESWRQRLAEAESLARSALAQREEELERALAVALEREKTKHEQDREASGRQLEGLVAELAALRAERQEIARELAARAAARIRIEERLHGVEADLVRERRSRGELETRIEAMERETAGLEAELATAKRAAAAAGERAERAEASALRDAASARDARARIEELERECAAWRSREREHAADASLRAEETAARESEQRREIEDLREKLQSLDRAWREDQRRLDDLMSDRARLATELDLTKDYIGELKERLRDREREAAQLRAQAASAQDQLLRGA